MIPAVMEALHEADATLDSAAADRAIRQLYANPPRRAE